MIVAQISDLHVKAPGLSSYRVVDCAGLLARALDALLALPQQPDVVIATGDLTDEGRPEEYLHLREHLARLPMPVYLLAGNHDERAGLRDAFPEHAYLRQWAPFLQYAIEDWPLRIVALDTVVPGRPEGRLCAERLDWLEGSLARARGKPTLLLMHHPPFRTLIGHMDRMGLAEGRERLEAIVRRNPQIERIVCGHLHRPIQVRFGGTVAQTCPSTAHQVSLNLSEDAPSRFHLEPPAFLLHAWTGGSLVTHTAYAGAFAGPYPFRDD